MGVWGSGFCGNCVTSESRLSSPGEDPSVGLGDSSSHSLNPLPSAHGDRHGALCSNQDSHRFPFPNTNLFSQTALQTSPFSSHSLKLVRAQKFHSSPKHLLLSAGKDTATSGWERWREAQFKYNFQPLAGNIPRLPLHSSLDTTLEENQVRDPRQPKGTGEMEGWRGK